MVRQPKPPSQNWRTFMANHIGQIAAVDFFTVPTIKPAHIFHWSEIRPCRGRSSYPRRARLWPRPIWADCTTATQGRRSRLAEGARPIDSRRTLRRAHDQAVFSRSPACLPIPRAHPNLCRGRDEATSAAASGADEVLGDGQGHYKAGQPCHDVEKGFMAATQRQGQATSFSSWSASGHRSRRLPRSQAHRCMASGADRDQPRPIGRCRQGSPAPV